MHGIQSFQTPSQAAAWLKATITGSLQSDSREVRPGDGFIAWPGAATDGRTYVNSAVSQGAVACLVESEGLDGFTFTAEAQPRMATYSQLKSATGPIASHYYSEPSQHLNVIAVTGTNGKTSTAWWLAQAMSSLPAPIRCGVVGTLGIGQPPQVVYNGLTTPDPVLLHRHFRSFVDEGFAACAIEASSIGLAEHRLDGVEIRVAMFTNFTQDHLDYHGDMSSYWKAKEALFSWRGLQAAVVNIDDPAGLELSQMLDAGKLDLWTVSCEREARVYAKDVRYSHDGLVFTVVEGDVEIVLRTQLIGQYNVSNLLGVIAAMRASNVGLGDAVAACGNLSPVPGRMDCVSESDAPLIAIDYAHTPDALDKAIAALRPLADQRGGRLWCVFGCGGDRDPIKRPLMAAVAEKAADVVVVTSDNPRREKPEVIISQILLGVVNDTVVQVEVDRARAIAETIAQCEVNDVVLIAGKGHEDFQEVNGVKTPFSDREHALSALMAFKSRDSKGLA